MLDSIEELEAVGAFNVALDNADLVIESINGVIACDIIGHFMESRDISSHRALIKV